MSVFTLATSCLTTFNLPWFMDLTFQVPMPLLLFTASNFSFITSYIHHLVLVLLWLHLFILLVLFLHWSPVAYRATTNLLKMASSSFSILSFYLFIFFMVFSRQEYWSGLPFPSPVDHALSQVSTVTCLSWVALHVMAHSFIELDKAMVHVISLLSFQWLFSFVWRNIRDLMEASL